MIAQLRPRTLERSNEKRRRLWRRANSSSRPPFYPIIGGRARVSRVELFYLRRRELELVVWRHRFRDLAKSAMETGGQVRLIGVVIYLDDFMDAYVIEALWRSTDPVFS